MKKKTEYDVEQEEITQEIKTVTKKMIMKTLIVLQNNRIFLLHPH